jgi:spore germination cell wall hydrolase CwlJ-like protein
MPWEQITLLGIMVAASLAVAAIILGRTTNTAGPEKICPARRRRGASFAAVMANVLIARDPGQWKAHEHQIVNVLIALYGEMGEVAARGHWGAARAGR